MSACILCGTGAALMLRFTVFSMGRLAKSRLAQFTVAIVTISIASTIVWLFLRSEVLIEWFRIRAVKAQNMAFPPDGQTIRGAAVGQGRCGRDFRGVFALRRGGLASNISHLVGMLRKNRHIVHRAELVRESRFP